MKEIFRGSDPVRLRYLHSILEAEGIETHIRNRTSADSGTNTIPIPEFFPALCVVNDGEFGRAMEAIRKRIQEDSSGSDIELICPACGEKNPGNFDLCWSCQAELPQRSGEV